MVLPLRNAICRLVSCPDVWWDPEATRIMDWKFERLGRLAATTSKPRFVVAYFMAPHEPYVYRADCSHATVREAWPKPEQQRAAYLAQIECVNRKLLTAIDGILRDSQEPPVILIQSDHGHGHLTKEYMELEEASPAMVRARLDIFSAYRVPGSPDTLFYDGMTPVNLLPRVFNYVFGTALPSLPNRSIWAVKNTPYRLTAIPPDAIGGP